MAKGSFFVFCNTILNWKTIGRYVHGPYSQGDPTCSTTYENIALAMETKLGFICLYLPGNSRFLKIKLTAVADSSSWHTPCIALHGPTGVCEWVIVLGLLHRTFLTSTALLNRSCVRH